MFIGDVGQGQWEEVDYAAAGASGINYGWKICEGSYIRGSDTELCNMPELQDPILEFSSASGSGNCSVTGGYVYRGPISNLGGYYVYADYCSARIWLAGRDGPGWSSEEVGGVAGSRINLHVWTGRAVQPLCRGLRRYFH